MRYSKALNTVATVGAAACAVVSGCSGDDCLPEVSIFLDNSAAKGFTTFKDNGKEVEWFVQMTLLDVKSGLYADCTTEDGKFIDINWHIHVGASVESEGVGSECGPTEGSPPVGGHYDPTFACSPVTGELEPCAALGRTPDDDYMYMCSPESYETDPYSCEVGDYSGKFGALRFEVKDDETAYTDSKGVDRYGPPLELVNGRSVVFHCMAPRIVCGNLFAKGEDGDDDDDDMDADMSDE